MSNFSGQFCANISLASMMGNVAQVLFCLTLSAFAVAQTTATLQTTETRLQVEAGTQSPRLIILGNSSFVWNNRATEPLISSIEIAGQSYPVEWRFNPDESRRDKNKITFVYDSHSPDLRLTWEWQARSEHGPIEHETRIENRESHEIWLPLQSSLTFDWEIEASDEFDHFYVEKGADTPSADGIHLVRVNDGYQWKGTSSTYAQPRPGETREIIPYFLVQRVGASPPGWYVGIEFSGRTHLTLARNGNLLHGELGLNPDPGPFRTRLLPGETFETPRIFLGANAGGPDEAANILHRWVREVLGNQAALNDPRYPFAVNNSWGSGMAVDETLARRMIGDAADLGFEMFHMDAGWFRGVGDWQPDPKKFPNGLQPIADAAHARGLKFGLWVDWAQAALGTAPRALSVRDPIVKNWLTKDLPPDWKPEEFKGQTIDIGIPDAEQWALRETARIVSDYKLDMLEHDGYLVAQGCDSSDHPHAPPDPLNECTYRDAGFVFVRSSNSTDVSYHAARAYYDIQSNLRRNHPGLLLEVCNDGGRMVDFGSAAQGDYFSITDTYDPISNRRAFYDTSFVLPPAMLEAYVERWPASQLENFRYTLRSGMMGWLSVMIDTTAWNAQQHAIAKGELQLYKTQLRPLIRDADLYHISERPDGIRWDGMEYFDSAKGHGVVYAFRGSTAELAHKFKLKGLKRTARYRLRFHDHSSADQVVDGNALMKTGVLVRLPVANSSEIIFVEEMPELRSLDAK